MQIDAIGASLASENTTQNNSINQDDFIKLFLAQLTFQDPLEPVNNEQFLAQMAQFANLEQTRLTNESLDKVVFMSSGEQALSMLGKKVEVQTQNGNVLGQVSAIAFSTTGASLTVTKPDDSFISDVRISNIRLITE